MNTTLCATFPGTWADGGCTLNIPNSRSRNINAPSGRDTEITSGDAGQAASMATIKGFTVGTAAVACLLVCAITAFGAFKIMNMKERTPVKVATPVRKDGGLVVDILGQDKYSDGAKSSGEA